MNCQNGLVRGLLQEQLSRTCRKARRSKELRAVRHFRSNDPALSKSTAARPSKSRRCAKPNPDCGACCRTGRLDRTERARVSLPSPHPLPRRLDNAASAYGTMPPSALCGVLRSAESHGFSRLRSWRREAAALILPTARESAWRSLAAAPAGRCGRSTTALGSVRCPAANQVTCDLTANPRPPRAERVLPRHQRAARPTLKGARTAP